MRIILILFVFFVYTSLFSQIHNQFWGRVSTNYSISKKWQSSLELMHRTQGNAQESNAFSYPLTNAARIWVNYKINKYHVINMSPYAFFSNDPIYNKPTDLFKKNTNEHRVQIQYEYTIPVVKSIEIKSRFGVEGRIFEDFTPLLRCRIRESIQYNLSKKIAISLMDEYFFNTINVAPKNIFDQNRVTIQPSYSINQRFKIDFGFSYVNAKGRTTSEINTNYMYFSNLTYSINKK